MNDSNYDKTLVVETFISSLKELARMGARFEPDRLNLLRQSFRVNFYFNFNFFFNFTFILSSFYLNITELNTDMKKIGGCYEC